MEVLTSWSVFFTMTTMCTLLAVYIFKAQLWPQTVGDRPSRSSFTFRILNITDTVDRKEFYKCLSLVISQVKGSVRGVGPTLLGWSYAEAGHKRGLFTATITLEAAPTPNELERLLKRQLSSDCPMLRIDTEFFGMTSLHDPSDAAVDIIAVTGLAGHAFGSWQSRNGSFMWLRDFLPKDIPHARILSYGYDTRLPGSQSTSSISDLARRFLESVKTIRSKHYKHRPLIFIGHSLGGLIIKKALSDALGGSHEDQCIFRSCCGLVFFGVPNKGLELESLEAMVRGQPNENFLKDCRRESPYLATIHQDFSEKFHQDSQIISVFETKVTKTVKWSQRTRKWERTGPSLLMVPPSSALNAGKNEKFHDQLSIDADHSYIVKFNDMSDVNYITISNRLVEMAEKGCQIVSRRMVTYREDLSQTTREFLQALRAPDFASFKNEKIENPAEGTLQWLPLEPQFHQWKTASTSSMLWVQGTPGQGKTVLSKFAVAYLQNQATVRERVFYFFFYDRDDRLQTMDALLRSLIKQLVISIAADGIITETISRDNLIDAEDDLWELFKSLLMVSNLKSCYFIIDALDECTQDSRKLVFRKFKGLLSHQLNESLPNLKIMFTSRPAVDINRDLRQISSLELKAKDEDLHHLLVSKLGSLDHLDDDLSSIARDLLLRGAGRTFLWIAIILKRLERMTLPTRAKLEELIEDTPTDLDVIYENILTRILDDTSGEMEQKLLVWVAYARRPMTLTELEDAIATQADSTSWQSLKRYRPKLGKSELLSSTAGVMLEFTEDDRVHLLHQSAKSYLLRSNLLANAVCVRKMRPQSYIATTCLTYLHFDEFRSEAVVSSVGHSKFEQFPLLYYAAHNWHFHVQESGEIPRLARLVRQLAEPNSPVLRLWAEVIGLPQLKYATSLWDIATIANILWLVSMDSEQMLVVTEQKISKIPTTVRGYNIIETLLEQSYTTFTADAQAAIVQKFDESIIRLLVKRADFEFQAANIEQALCNQNPTSTLRLLLRLGHEVTIDQKLITLIVSNRMKSDICELLFRHEAVQLMEEAVPRLLADFTPTMIKFIPERHRIDITPTTLKAMGLNVEGPEIMKFVLSRPHSTRLLQDSHILQSLTPGSLELLLRFFPELVDVTTDLLNQVSLFEKKDQSMVLTLLLIAKADRVPTTQGFLISLLFDLNKETLHVDSFYNCFDTWLSRDRDSACIDESVIRASIKTQLPKVIASICENLPPGLRLTEDILRDAINCNLSIETMKLLLDSLKSSSCLPSTLKQYSSSALPLIGLSPSDIEVHPDSTSAKVSEGNMVLLDRNMIQHLFQNWDTTGMKTAELLFRDYWDDVRISENALFNKTMSHDDCEDLIWLLFRSEGFRLHIVDRNVMGAFDGNLSTRAMAELIMSNCYISEITDEILDHIVSCCILSKPILERFFNRSLGLEATEHVPSTSRPLTVKPIPVFKLKKHNDTGSPYGTCYRK